MFHKFERKLRVFENDVGSGINSSGKLINETFLFLFVLLLSQTNLKQWTCHLLDRSSFSHAIDWSY